jgi:hypothetical protein
MAPDLIIRNRLFNIRATTAELEHWRKAAAERRVTLSDLMRESIEARIGPKAMSLR